MREERDSGREYLSPPQEERDVFSLSLHATLALGLGGFKPAQGKALVPYQLADSSHPLPSKFGPCGEEPPVREHQPLSDHIKGL